MAKLTTQIIKDLYSYGKAVYDRQIGLNDATDAVLSKYPGQIAESSASFYIGLYAEYMSGKGSTWNQNSELVLYYVEHITKEIGLDAGKKAFEAGMKFAQAKSKKELIKDLDELWKSLSGEIERTESKDDWWPSFSEYSPGITKDQWLHLLNNQITIKPDWYTILGMFYTQKDGATCSALGIKFNRQPMSISGSCTQMAKRIFTETNCPLITDEGQDKYWPILFQGKAAASGETGSFVWRLRPELYDALTDFNILRYLPSDNGDSNKRTMPDSIKETISKIKTYIVSHGFSYPDGLIENFYLSLKSKPFVILAGTSGTGKTRLVKLFAEAIGADYYLVPVRPDWSDGSDLFGHTDLNGAFVKGPICAAFEAAQENPERPVFICLDEMNLARVEYYLSDFLSVIESREKEADGSIRTSAIAQYEGGIPENLYIVGTVNMDETTFPFSRKVLDRANTIEFNYVDLMPAFEDAAAGEEPLALPNEFLRSEYLLLVRDCAEDAPYVGENCSILQEINGILLEANAHVGYRVRDEIVFYMLNNEHAEGLISKDQAMDNEIMQKILPRIQGSSASVKTMLCRLFAVCAADHNQKSGETDSEKMRKILKDEGVICRYRKSAEKIEMMVRRFEEDGFTSYWL